MTKILANDGIDAAGKEILLAAGFEVVTDKVPQETLSSGLVGFDAILVRSATQVRKEHIDANPGLKVIGRAGVGMDNIDVAYAREKGVKVINTPEASSQSVAELVISKLFAFSRLLPDAVQHMPSVEDKEGFNKLKKRYSEGYELAGKTIGIIGFGMIGQTVAKLAAGLGMRVIAYRRNPVATKVQLDLTINGGPVVDLNIPFVTLETLFAESDFITLHIPFPKGSEPVVAAKEFEMMKSGVCIVNTARGGAVAETALLKALDDGKVAWAGLDVFEGEPSIKPELRAHARVLLTPHIGGSTREAQQRIGIELAEKVVNALR